MASSDGSATTPVRAVVCGGAHGIGRAIVELLASRGCDVVVADRDAYAVKALSEEFDRVAPVEVDVADPTSVLTMFAQIDAQWPRWDSYIHCAGIGLTRPFLGVTAQEWSDILAVNLHGTFLCCTEAGRRLAAAGGGSIVALGSVAAQRPSFAGAPYASSKAAAELLVQGLAMELGPVGVRANVLAPGPINTGLARRLHSSTRRQEFVDRVPLTRYGEPDEVANVAVFLASAESSFITGQVIYVDGGMSCVNTPRPTVSPAAPR